MLDKFLSNNRVIAVNKIAQIQLLLLSNLADN